MFAVCIYHVHICGYIYILLWIIKSIDCRLLMEDFWLPNIKPLQIVEVPRQSSIRKSETAKVDCHAHFSRGLWFKHPIQHKVHSRCCKTLYPKAKKPDRKTGTNAQLFLSQTSCTVYKRRTYKQNMFFFMNLSNADMRLFLPLNPENCLFMPSAY